MKVTKYGHACVLVEQDGARILVDPGIYSKGFEDLDGLTGILVTHAHADHADIVRLAALAHRNPAATVVADEGTAASLRDAGLEVTVAREGDRLDVGTEVRVFGRTHTPVHADIPAIPNVAYLFAERLFHPGDSLTMPGVAVEVLALPVAGPWLKVGEAIEYLRAVSPRVVIPIHESVLAKPENTFRVVQQLAPSGVDVLIPPLGDAVEV